ncbi:MAG: hemerythrin domain-containing protein [Rhodospirillaceae bacterium]
MAFVWTDDLNVGVEMMDHDHQEMFVVLNSLSSADDEHFLALFDELVRLMSAHFERENELMVKHNFFAYHCHNGEHEAVLTEVRALREQAAAGSFGGARSYVESVVGPWFLNHRNTMDFVTAQFLKSVGAV